MTYGSKGKGRRTIDTNNIKASKGSDKIKAGFVKKGARGITIKDVQKVVNKAQEINKRFNPKGPLGRFIEDAQLLLALVKDYWKGRYRRIPFFGLAVIVFSLLYVLNPWDLVPDFIPFVGQIDDASVITICLIMVEQELHAYRDWRTKLQSQSNSES